MAGTNRVNRFLKVAPLPYLRATITVVIFVAALVWFLVVGRKALINYVAPPPRATVVRTLSPTSPREDSQAERILAAGLAQAKRESKRVFFHASGTHCRPCQLLNRFLEDNRELFQTDFVDVKVDLEDRDFREISNGYALLLRLRNFKYDGVPWIAILEPDGRVVATSDRPSGKNAGFFSNPEGIRDFMRMLRKGVKRTTPAQLAEIEKKIRGDD